MKKIQVGAVLSIAAMFLFACASKQSSSSTQTITSEVKAQLTMSPDQLEVKNLFETNCGKCHKLYDRSAFSKENWKPIVERMTRKARLTSEQGEKIYSYISM
ncbi:cytochrome c [Flavobacterium sp.]|uniref:cytochrome c n=1 Tax=Flavobacterium sp. TaxID=239 RepID=UPI0035AE0382